MSASTVKSFKNTPHAQNASVAIIGGGLSGLAAGCALADAGYAVTLFERRPYLGGRASSYEHPGTGEVVDNCQHVLLGCCTNLINFYRRLGVEDRIRWYERLTFIAPGGESSDLYPTPGLPSPFHSSPAFLKYSLLSVKDKALIGLAMMALMEHVPEDRGTSFLEWLKRRGQTQRAIDRFWAPVLVSALNDDLDQVSVHYGAMVFRDAFLKSAQAGRMGLPMVPLSELYGVAAEYIGQRGGQVHLRSSVERFDALEDHAILMANGERLRFDYAISAVPFNALERILPETFESDSLRARLTQFQSVPITGIHLWFDREITQLDHAVLLDRTIQWMFQKSRILGGRSGGPLAAGSYIELVVSSSKTLLEKSRQEIIDLALRELAEFFPTVNAARVLKATVIKEVHATFSPSPGLDKHRPHPASPWKRVFLSGDWTATGWPATMEGAVRGGYATAEALARANGDSTKFLVPDLPAHGLMRLFK